MKNLILIAFLSILFSDVIAQNVVYNEEPAIKELVEEYRLIKEENSEFKGFRVQLYSSSDYQNAKKVRFEFLQNFNDISAYLNYQQPNYKIRVGNFRTRLEAEKFKAELQKNESFKACFIVPDKIEFPKL